MSSYTSLFRVLSPSRVQTKFEEKTLARYTDIMVFCLVQGDAIKNSFPIDTSSHTTVGHLKEAIKKAKRNAFSGIDANKLTLWRVNIVQTKENQEMTIEEHKGVELHSFETVGTHFQEVLLSTDIRIIVEPPATTVSPMHVIPDGVKIEIKNKVAKAFPHINILSIDQLIDALALIWNVEAVESDPPSSKDDPCVKLRMEPSFFKINLPSTITQQSATPVDLCLPPYKSKSGMNYLNPFYDDPQFKKTVSLVREKLMNPRDITVLAGVSGGGKTSTAFGISIQYWTIYIDFSPSRGHYGDFMGQELEKIRAKPPEYGQTQEQSKVYNMLDLGIISRGLLLIKMLAQKKISTPKEWLFAQLQIMNTNRITNSLKALDAGDISSLFEIIIECLDVKSLILIFDEAQVLCNPVYGDYNGSSLFKKRWNLLQAYIDHLTHLPVTCLIAGTYMHMASGVSLVTSIGKVPGSHAHIVLKLPFLSPNDILRNLEAVIDLTDVTPETCNYLIYVLRGRPRNCASFVRKLISERKPMNRTKDQELRKLIRLWLVDISSDMADYLENTCKYVGANNLHPGKAIMDVLRLRVFYNQKFSHAIELLKHSIIPCISPKCVKISHKKTSKNKNKININTSFESYLVSGIEEFFLRGGKTLVDVFVDNIILLNNTSSIGNEFDAVFITAIIQKRGHNVRNELNKWKNGQKFDLPSWITPTMTFKTISNLSGTIPLDKYVNDKIYYRHAIQPEIYSGSDSVLSLVDDEQNVILLSASCTVSGKPIKRKKIKEQLIKSCMKFQYMECPNKRKNSPCLQVGLDYIPANNEKEVDDMEEDDMEEDDMEVDDMEVDGLEEDDMKEDDEEEDDEEEDDEEENDGEEEEYKQDLDFGGVDYDLDYTENTKKYRISRISKRARNHEKIKTSTENRRHIYVSVELPRRQGKRSRLFRINEYGDLVIIVDDRNMKYVFGSVIEELVKRIRENKMDETDGRNK